MEDKANSTTHGYSGKPLFQKIGLKAGMRCLPLNSPEPYQHIVRGAEGVTFLDAVSEAEIVHLFCANRAVLEEEHVHALSYVTHGGMLWVSWPKKSSPLFKGLTGDVIREVILPTGWVDVKVCAVDENWSGLKFLLRKK